MTVKRHKFIYLFFSKTKMRRAITLVEVMIATAVLVIAATGALSYQYHAAKGVKIAHAQSTGTRIAQLLLEDWMSTGGSDEYDPTDLKLGFSAAPVPSGFEKVSGNPLKNSIYVNTVDELPLMVMLTWADVDQDLLSDVTLRRLSAVVRFGSTSSELKEITQQVELIRPITLTTYVRIDAAGG
jgi:type II secretory pathway pseudopilin PulG